MLFENIAARPSAPAKKAKAELTRTIAFMTVVRDQGCRLSYAALAVGAKVLGENDSNQIAAQRGSSLVKQLPEELQPFVCRRKGGYAKEPATMSWAKHAPENLVDLPVIRHENVEAAVEQFLSLED